MQAGSQPDAARLSTNQSRAAREPYAQPVFDRSPLSTIMYAPDGRPVYLNPAFTRLWGLTLETLLPDYCILTDPQLAANGLLPLVQRAFAGTDVALPPFHYDAAPLADGAQARWTEAFLYPILDASGGVQEVVLTQFDVTERVEAEALVRSQVEALRRTVGHLADTADLDGLLGHVLAEIVRQAGAAVGHLFTYDQAADTLLLQATVRDGQRSREPWPDDPPLFQGPFPSTITPVVAELRASQQLGLLSTSGFVGWAWPGTLEWHRAQGHRDAAVLALLAGEQLVGVLGLGFQHTPQLSAADVQLIQTLGQQAALAIQLTRLAADARRMAVLEERTRLAREIHDTLAQGFTGIIVQLQTAAAIAATDPAGQQTHLEMAVALAKSSLDAARRSVGTLRAPALRSTDLGGALRDLAQQQTAQTGIAVSVAVSGTPAALPAETIDQLLAIGREAVTNVVRHAQARSLRLVLEFSPDALLLTVQDNGVGFAPQLVDPQRYGLLGIRERARQIGAELALESAAGNGTTLSVRLPLRATPGAKGEA